MNENVRLLARPVDGCTNTFKRSFIYCLILRLHAVNIHYQSLINSFTHSFVQQITILVPSLCLALQLDAENKVVSQEDRGLPLLECVSTQHTL